MTTEGIDAVFLETHNWGKSAKFFQGLGYEIEFATDHNSGQLRRGDSPYLFVAEVPESEPTHRHVVLGVADAADQPRRAEGGQRHSAAAAQVARLERQGLPDRTPRDGHDSQQALRLLGLPLDPLPEDFRDAPLIITNTGTRRP